jgi:hypothetical protein
MGGMIRTMMPQQDALKPPAQNRAKTQMIYITFEG